MTNELLDNYQDDPVDDITLLSDAWLAWLDYTSSHVHIGPAAGVEVDHTDS